MAKKQMLKVDGRTVGITHADKILFPDDNITKGDLIDYYHQIAGTMLPYLRGRPVMMHRFTQGIKGEGFYQKEAGDYFPDWVKRATLKKQDGSTDYAVCDDAATLVYLAEQDCITPHVWLSRVDRPDNPDLMIFDMDPSDGDFEPVRRAAFAMRDLLSELGLPSFVKTTGSRGLHVAVPLDRKAGFDLVRRFARDAAGYLARLDTKNLTVEQRKDKRRGRVYIDVMRNGYAQTAVAPYAVRARPGAPVAAPLDWDELKDPRLNARSYTLTSIFRRLDRKGDPWAGIWQQAVSLNEASQRLNALRKRKGE
jgi:bifunctional non-homologous end joining protein LigD